MGSRHAAVSRRRHRGSVSPPVRAALLGLAMALAAGGVSSASPTIPTCESLEKACLAHVARARALVAKAPPGKTVVSDPTDIFDDRCYNAYAEARKNGVWPSRKGGPSAPCSN